jgi:hypothetical protein
VGFQCKSQGSASRHQASGYRASRAHAHKPRLEMNEACILVACVQRNRPKITMLMLLNVISAVCVIYVATRMDVRSPADECRPHEWNDLPDPPIVFLRGSAILSEMPAWLTVAGGALCLGASTWRAGDQGE